MELSTETIVGVAVGIAAVVVVTKMMSSSAKTASPVVASGGTPAVASAGTLAAAASSTEDFVQEVVAQVDDIPEGGMKAVALGDGKVLLTKYQGEINATSSTCSHLGAPLITGVFANGRVRCPWHGACFNVKTGDIEDFPCVDHINSFKVTVSGSDVTVRAPAAALASGGHRRAPRLAACSSADTRVFVVVGGGPAGLTAVQTLRERGFTGRIVMINKENALPYDRTKLSKTLKTTADKALLRPATFFTSNNIETRLGAAVVSLDAAAHTVTLDSGDSLHYDSLLLAPGGDPRRVPAPGADLGNIFFLRVPADSNGIAEAAPGKKVVIVGSSFIGMEAASCLAKLASSVVVVGMEEVPFERVLGKEIGVGMKALAEKNGITFRMKEVVKQFVAGDDGKVASVVLGSGEVLEADVVVIGAGIVPATAFVAPECGLTKAGDQSIVVDKYLHAGNGIFVAGDVARFPYFLTNEMVRVEHYGASQYMGRIAAQNMLGLQTPMETVPFFWTAQFGKTVRYAGHALSFDQCVIDGSVSDLSFVAYYVRADRVLGVASLGKDPAAAAYAELAQTGVLPSLAESRAAIAAAISAVSSSK